jgi:putative flippase GtrA
VFPDSDQGIAKGYAYFLVNAGVGLVITLAVFAAFIWWVEIHYLLARLIASAVAGIAVFFLNAVFNFKEL